MIPQKTLQNEISPEQEIHEIEPKERNSSRKGGVDIPFTMLVLMLSAIGLIMLFSASYASSLQDGNDPSRLFIRQGLFMVIGLTVMFAISRLNYQILRALAVPLMVLSLALLILVLFFGVTINHARRWFDFGFITIQPSEIAKLAVVICFAAMISTYRERMKTFTYGVLPFAGLLVAMAVLLWREPHLSGMVLIVGVGAVLMFAGGTRLVWFAGLAAVAAPLAYYVVEKMGYAQQRIQYWQDPWLDPKGKGMQAIQSLYAIGSGGLFGLGLGRSRQKFLYLPEEHNDFIFSIVCEELGFIGATIILLLFAVLILRGFWIAIHSPDRFGSLMVTGVSTWLALQIFLNVAVVTNLIPVTGISMPFFSSGGSALVIQLASMGIVMSVSRQIPTKTLNYEL